MKKYLVVLLIAVLAVSSVFAGVTGYAQAKYQVNFDKGTFGYSDPTSVDNIKAKIVFDDLFAAKKGEGKTYVDAAASFAWNAKEYDGTNADSPRFQLDVLGFFKLTLDKLTIVGQDWSLNLLKAEELGNYAASTLDYQTWYRHDHMNVSGTKAIDKTTASSFAAVSDDDVYKTGKAAKQEMTYRDDYKDYAKTVAYSSALSYYLDSDNLYGTTLTFKGWKVATAVNGSVGSKQVADKNYLFGIETPDFNFSGIDMKAAAGFTYRDNGDSYDKSFKNCSTKAWVIGASYKAAYATEKLATSVATDQTVSITGEAKAKEYKGDVLATLDFAPVKATVFFGKNAKSSKGYDTIYTAGNGGDGKSYKFYFTKNGDVYKENKIDNLLLAVT